MSCANCQDNIGLELHHIVPRALGGSDLPSNLVLLCGRCHMLVHGSKARDISKLTKLGLERAKANGQRLGRPLSKGIEAIEVLRLEGKTQVQVAAELALSLSTVKRHWRKV